MIIDSIVSKFLLGFTSIATWEQCSRARRDHFQDQPTHAETPEPPHGWSWYPGVRMTKHIFMHQQRMDAVALNIYDISQTQTKYFLSHDQNIQNCLLFSLALLGGTPPIRPSSRWSLQWCQMTTWQAQADWAASTAPHAQPQSTRGPGHTGRPDNSYCGFGLL